MSKIKESFLPESVRNRKDLDIRAGDTVRVNVKIQEKGKTRIQAFEGLVLARKHGAENGGTFTVRKVSNGVGVERIFPLYSPAIDSIEILRRAKVRQSKLYFLRDVVSKTLRYKLRRTTDMGTGTADLPDWMNDDEPQEEAIEYEEEVAVEETADESAAEAPAEEAKADDGEETPAEVAETEAPAEEDKAA
ncbi:50S ribosomal protein L19 [Patescibacteria group bacterium]|nr:50S ribosomal protein L19 [Patescibacteria group bacterium]